MIGLEGEDLGGVFFCSNIFYIINHFVNANGTNLFINKLVVNWKLSKENFMINFGKINFLKKKFKNEKFIIIL